MGLNPRESGLVMSSMMISFILGSIISGQIMTKIEKYRMLSYFSAAAIILGTLLLMNMDINTSYPVVTINLVILSIGVGCGYKLKIPILILIIVIKDDLFYKNFAFPSYN